MEEGRFHPLGGLMDAGHLGRIDIQREGIHCRSMCDEGYDALNTTPIRKLRRRALWISRLKKMLKGGQSKGRVCSVPLLHKHGKTERPMESHFQDILQEAQAAWMDIPGVVIVAQGKVNDDDCIVVFFSHTSPEMEAQIPSEYKGIPVDVRESGVISAGG